jgi:hypothetical protein
MREKSGWGRESRNEFNIISEVGTAFFEKLDEIRKWRFSFEEYYDVYIWDSNAGRNFTLLQRKLEETMARAIRMRELKDMFAPASEILKTIHKDPATNRCVTVKPGDGLQSMWDMISNGSARATSFSIATGEQREGLSDTYKYTEADEVEDAVLFPEEGTGEEKDNLFREKLSMVDEFERKPMLDIRRFAEDADTDEELSSDEDSAEIASDEGDEAWDTEGSDHSYHVGKNESGWEGNHEYTSGDPEDAEKAIDLLTKQLRSMSRFTKEPDYFVPIVKNPSSAWQVPAAIRENAANLMATLRLSLMRQRDYDDMDHNVMEADFMRHIDREKSKGKQTLMSCTLCI